MTPDEQFILPISSVAAIARLISTSKLADAALVEGPALTRVALESVASSVVVNGPFAVAAGRWSSAPEGFAARLVAPGAAFAQGDPDQDNGDEQSEECELHFRTIDASSVRDTSHIYGRCREKKAKQCLQSVVTALLSTQ